ncbi:MAG: tetratricopeptide repeat protein, partial [Proteobacteria bacterium]|nr:tetratricopeptide repeat protein [Pseudomonadota bacterium]
ARQHLEEGDADNAIRSLERAVVLDPSNGQNYYYLSEAWLQKGNMDQALKFNELAEIHLANQSRWDAMVIEQKRRILDQSE